jgi:glycosyltransferase involved in cell wall biosynthesis
MQHPALKEADAVVLHWINHGFLGSSDLRGLLDLGKPVLWHMHDQWAFTGGCHYSGACTAFEMACGSCPQLRRSGPGDRSRRQFMERQQWAAQAGDRLALVAPSEWLAGLAAKSGIVRGSGAWVRCIPNPFDPAVDGQGLQPRLVSSGHSRPRLFFAAVNPSDSRKGWDLLMMALEHLGREGMVCDVEVAGKVTEPARSRVQALEAGGHQVTWLGLLGPKAMQEAYARADLFVIPSLQENFPNTVLESFAVGTPVVGFAAGGIASMIVEGQNGALAPAVDPWASEASKAMAAFNLASAMLRVVQHPQGNLLRRGAHQSLEQVRPERVAKDYTDLIHAMLQNSSKVL